MSGELAVTDRHTERQGTQTTTTSSRKVWRACCNRQTDIQRDKGQRLPLPAVGMFGELAVTDRQTHRETRDTDYDYQQ